ncbi:MAG: CPBP family intramembrane metalloprotease [Ruminococcus sp.]|jgi:membrane protease YdiL (CAAX protease family)|nr:CPBP family intramembrane metalloprotease [Ruminococcus sp.]
MEEQVNISGVRPPKGFGKVWYIIYPMLIYFGMSFVVNCIVFIPIAISLAQANPFTGGNILEYSTELSTKIREAAAGQMLLISIITGFLSIGVMLPLFIRDIKKRGLYEKKPAKTGVLPYIFMALTVAGYSLFFLSLINLTSLHQIFSSMLTNDQMVSGQNPLLVFLLLSVITPIMEEFFFRGLIFKRLRGMMSFVPAAIIASIIFGIGHGSLPQIIYTFCLSLGLCYIYEKYGSILVTMFTHFVLNAIVFISNYTLTPVLSEKTSLIIIFIVSGVVFIGGLIPLLLSLKKMPPLLHKMPSDI